METRLWNSGQCSNVDSTKQTIKKEPENNRLGQNTRRAQYIIFLIIRKIYSRTPLRDYQGNANRLCVPICTINKDKDKDIYRERERKRCYLLIAPSTIWHFDLILILTLGSFSNQLVLKFHFLNLIFTMVPN